MSSYRSGLTIVNVKHPWLPRGSKSLCTTVHPMNSLAIWRHTERSLIERDELNILTLPITLRLGNGRTVIRSSTFFVIMLYRGHFQQSRLEVAAITLPTSGCKLNLDDCEINNFCSLFRVVIFIDLAFWVDCKSACHFNARNVEMTQWELML